MRVRFAIIIIISTVILLSGGLASAKEYDGFATQKTIEEITANLLSALDITAMDEEPSKQIIRCFDASESGISFRQCRQLLVFVSCY